MNITGSWERFWENPFTFFTCLMKLFHFSSLLPWLDKDALLHRFSAFAVVNFTISGDGY